MNFYALSTPPGVSGIAIIRISGETALQVANQLTNSEIKESRTALLCKLQDRAGDLIDEAIVIWYPENKSYTGQHLVELHIHGSKAVIKKLLDELDGRKDCRIAQAGEFTKTAYRNNKINLYEAESIADLLAAETEAQRVQALRLKQSYPKFLNWREVILDVLSKTEASIDFSEEDLPKNILEENEIKIRKIKKEIDEMLDDSMGEIVRDGYKITILGPPNAGKSSFLNMLLKREAAIVSSQKGTTRDLIEAKFQINNYPVILVDTAGIRKATNKVEKVGIKFALRASKNSNLDILILDGSEKSVPTEVKQLISRKTLIILNKKDKKSFNKKRIIKDLEGFDYKDIIEISVKKNLGISKLSSLLQTTISNIDSIQSSTLISRARHRSLMTKCSARLKDYLNICKSDEVEKAAEELRLSSNQLSHIVGFIGVEEILGKIFQDFCIGK